MRGRRGSSFFREQPTSKVENSTLTPVSDFKKLLEKKDWASARKALSGVIPKVFLTRKASEQLDLVQLIFEFELHREAVRVFERDPALAVAFKFSQSGELKAEQRRSVRFAYSRLLVRCGHFLHAWKVLRNETPRTALEYQFFGYFKMALGNPGNALPEFEKSFALDPGSLICQGSYLHALAHAGDSKAAVNELRKILERQLEPSARFAVAVRLAEAMRLSGYPREAANLLGKLSSESPERTKDLTEGFRLHALGSCLAAMGDLDEARKCFTESLEIGLGLDFGYTNLIFNLRRMHEAGVAPREVSNLLMALNAKSAIPGAESLPRGPMNRTGVAGAALSFSFDLGRNEYRMPGTGGLLYNLPLELQLVAWVALISPVFAVPRPLLLDLLWPDADGPVSELQLRLTKLLARVESVYGLRLRSKGNDEIRMSAADLDRIEVKLDPNARIPSYFESTVHPTSQGFAAYYSLSIKQARHYMRELREQSGVAAERLKVRSTAGPKNRRSARAA